MTTVTTTVIALYTGESGNHFSRNDSNKKKRHERHGVAFVARQDNRGQYTVRTECAILLLSVRRRQVQKEGHCFNGCCTCQYYYELLVDPGTMIEDRTTLVAAKAIVFGDCKHV